MIGSHCFRSQNEIIIETDPVKRVCKCLLSGTTGAGHAGVPLPFLLRTKISRLVYILRGCFVVDIFAKVLPEQNLFSSFRKSIATQDFRSTHYQAIVSLSRLELLSVTVFFLA